jgi:hypothetical protein
MLCDSAALSIGDEKLKSFGKTHESGENFNPPEFSAASSSDDSVAPAAKKVKVDLPHTREHGGKTYLLTEYGLKNFEKLLENKQLERGVPAKTCQECQEVMDWMIDGPITKGKKSWYFYQPRHNGVCKKRVSDEHNSNASAYDKELKEIDAKLIVLNAKKEKTKDDIKLISDLIARRAICFEKGKNSKSAPIKKKAAADARARGDCPGQADHGCPHKAKAPVINGRQKIYCRKCQEKVSANNDNVLESQRKAAERAKDIFVTVPHAEFLKSLGAIKTRQLVPATSLQKDIVGIDTSSAGGQGSTDWEDLNGVGGFYISSGIQHTFHARRTYATQKRTIESKWSISIDGATPQSFLLIPMLKSFAKFCSGRVICYHTAAAECDFKRLTSVFSHRTAAIISTSPFPQFETGWLNTGQDIYRHLIGPKNVPVLSTHWKLSIIHEDLYSLKSNASVYTPLDTGIVNIPSDVTNVVSDAMKTWNLAMLMKTILF